jgi:hypothetical protein
MYEEFSCIPPTRCTCPTELVRGQGWDKRLISIRWILSFRSIYNMARYSEIYLKVIHEKSMGSSRRSASILASQFPLKNILLYPASCGFVLHCNVKMELQLHMCKSVARRSRGNLAGTSTCWRVCQGQDSSLV